MGTTYDTVVMGGSLAGAATALMLKRRVPGMRILVIEKSEEFDRKVGESTSEVSACFLTRVLGLTNYLGHNQLPKQGLRMWFAKSTTENFTDCSEIGPKYQGRLPTFQLDRQKLDQHVLEESVKAGAELLRPAKIKKFDIAQTGSDYHQLEVEANGETQKISAKWLVDASGRVAMIGRKLGLLEPITEQPTAAIWGRFRGLKDWDSAEMKTENADFSDVCRTQRTWATNHLNGLGWWCWIIPLKGGDFSVGCVFDRRIFNLPEGPNLGERLKAHLLTHPVGRMLFEQATPVSGDMKACSQLPFRQKRIAEENWCMVGDTAGFMDPMYSPGLDFISYSTTNAVDLISRAYQGENISSAVDAYNFRWQDNFTKWFNGVYKNKYYYIGDAELMSTAFILDVSLYFIGPVRQAYSNISDRYTSPPYGGLPGDIVACIMRTYNRRFSIIAKKRIAAGTYGRRNENWRELYPGFSPDGSVLKLMRRAFFRWLKMEINALFLKPEVKTLPALLPEPQSV